MTVSPEAIEAELAALRAEIKNPAAGIFGPGSVSWAVDREGAIILGGGAAALLQLAHPFVAHAVDQHSATRSDPLGRFQRTFGHVFAMVFGDVDHAIAAARRVYAIHTKIRGRIKESVGAYARGDRYLANDEDALFWVHATLVHTSLRVHERLFDPLTAFEKERYYEESRRFARLFGVPDDRQPPDLASFFRYFDEMVASDRIAVGEPAREMGRFLLSPPTPIHLPIVGWLKIFTAGLLPPKLRAQYGLRYGAAEAATFEASCRLLRAGLRVTPARLRYQPAYIEAQKRLRGEPPHDRFGRWAESLVLSSLVRR